MKTFPQEGIEAEPLVVARHTSGLQVANENFSGDATHLRAEPFLAPAPERWQSILLHLGTAGVAIWRQESGSERVEFNDCGRALLGLPAGSVAMTQAELRERVHPQDLHLWAASTRRCMRTALPIQVLVRYLHPDGHWHQLLTQRTVCRTPDRRLSAFVGITLDVSEPLQSAATPASGDPPSRGPSFDLQAVAARAALATRAVGMGTWEVDLTTGRASWDEQMWSLRHLPPRSEPLNADERLALVHPDDRARVAHANSLAYGSEATVELEFRVMWPDGSVRWLASLSHEVHADGIHRRIGVNWDITEKHRTQQALQEREKALRESEARDVAQRRVLSRLSHDFRTPLNAVLGFTQLLLADERLAALTPTQRQSLMRIQDAGHDLLGQVNQALEIAKSSGAETSAAMTTQVSAMPATRAGTPAPGHRVLYIEDNPVNALLVKELLARRTDLQVQIAEDGTQGIAMARQWRPHLILIDMNLPDMDGLEVLRRLRNDPDLAFTTCVALSANAMPEDIQRALAAGMAAYWTKPLDFNVFLLALDSLLGAAPHPPTQN